MEISNKKEVSSMLIKFYNMQAGTRFRSENDANQNCVGAAINRADSVSDIKAHVRKWVIENGKHAETSEGFIECFGCFGMGATKEEPQVQEAPQEQAVGSAIGFLDKVVTELVARTSAEKIEAEVVAHAEDLVRAFIQKEYGAIERRIITVIDGQPKKIEGVQHEKFEEVVKFVANNEPVFLTGPAGSGKNVLCKQVAEALGLKFYFTNAVTQEYKLTGFTDAMGNYQETQFYKAFKYGGLFMLDEMDASIPEVLIILNAAIANRYFDFPAPIGYVEAHPDFRVIAAGNTTGQGASFEYVGRNQLDAASLDRFGVVKVNYSPIIEEACAGGDMELVKFCRDFRAAAHKTGQQVVVSYRAIGRIAKMLKLLSREEALETCLVKGMEKDDLNIIINELEESEYKKALRKIARAM